MAGRLEVDALCERLAEAMAPVGGVRKSHSLGGFLKRDIAEEATARIPDACGERIDRSGRAPQQSHP